MSPTSRNFIVQLLDLAINNSNNKKQDCKLNFNFRFFRDLLGLQSYLMTGQLWWSVMSLGVSSLLQAIRNPHISRVQNLVSQCCTRFSVSSITPNHLITLYLCVKQETWGSVHEAQGQGPHWRDNFHTLFIVTHPPSPPTWEKVLLPVTLALFLPFGWACPIKHTHAPLNIGTAPTGNPTYLDIYRQGLQGIQPAPQLYQFL